MMTTLNTMAVGADGIIKDIKVSVEITEGVGIHVVNMSDAGVKEMLLRVVTALTAIRYRIPGKKIVIAFSEEVTGTFSLVDAAVAIGLLIASGQVRPAIDYRSDSFAGELTLNGSIRVPDALHRCGCDGCNLEESHCLERCADRRDLVRYGLVDWLMHVVPEGMDDYLALNTDHPSLARNSLRDIVSMLEAPENCNTKI